jgi:hypothetical protein
MIFTSRLPGLSNVRAAMAVVQSYIVHDDDGGQRPVTAEHAVPSGSVSSPLGSRGIAFLPGFVGGVF